MTHHSIDNCLGRTCLKWGKDGELTELDLRLVLKRLCEVDDPVCASLEAGPSMASYQGAQELPGLAEVG